MKVKTIIFFRENEFLSWSSCCETIPYDAGMWLTYFDQIKKNEAGELWRLNFSIQVNIIFHFQMLHLISRISAPQKINEFEIWIFQQHDLSWSMLFQIT